MNQDNARRCSCKSKHQQKAKISDKKCLAIKALSYGTLEVPRKHMNISDGYPYTKISSVRKDKDVYHGDGRDEEKGGRGGDGRGGEGAIIHRKLITGQQQGIDCANNGEWIMTEGSGLMQK